MAEIRFRLVGQTTVIRDGTRLPVGARMHRALLALLAVHANRVVSVDRLIDSLWGEEPPGAATATLHAYVSQLRKLLEPERAARAPATVIVTRDPGYMLVVPEDNVDVLEFERLTRRGRSALEEGDAELANRVLGQALDLWVGEPLAEFSGEAWAASIMARLGEAHETAVEDRIDAWLTLGRHVAAATELERLVDESPLRERRWAQLMLALYRSHRQADSLRAFQRCRSVLGEQLGIDPGPELRALEQAVLAQDPGLNATAASPRPASPVVDEAPVPAGADGDLVAREPHLGRLSERITALKARGGAVVVAGEPGIGKTTLAEAAVGLARRARIVTAWSRCPDADTSPAYWVWTQLLSGVEQSSAVTAALATIGGSRPAPDAEGVARFESYQKVLAALAEAGPLVAVIDDVHAADESSLAVLRLIAGDLHRLPVLLVVTVRSTEGSSALVDTLGELVRQRGVERLMVGGLSVDDVTRLAQRALGSVVPDELAVALHDRTGGNPFYLGELLRLLGSQHRSRSLTAGDVAAVDVPTGVRDVIGRRVAGLPTDTQAILTLAAVGGREVDLDVLERAAGVDSAQLMLAVEPAVAGGLLVEREEAWGYRFTHVLISESLAGTASRLERARLHARIAEALESVAGADPARSAEIAYHFIQAGPLGDPARAVAWSRRAADRAEAQSAWSEAAVHLERGLAAIALTAADADAQRCDLLCRLGQCRRYMGDVVGAQIHLDEAIRIARAIGDPVRAAAAAAVFGTPALWSWRAPGECDGVVIDALEAALPLMDDPASKARVMATLAMELYYTPRRVDGERYADEAVKLARGLGDIELLGRVLNNALLTNWSPGHDEKALAITEESLSWAGRGLPRVMEIMARMHRMLPLIRGGNLVEFDAELARSRDILGELRMVEVELAAQVDFWECARQMLDGRWFEARRALEQAVEAQRRTSVWGADFNMMVGEITIRRATAGLAELADQLVGMAEQPAGQMLRPAAVLALVDAGNLDHARRRAGAWWTPIRYDWAWYWLFPLWGDVAATLGTPDPAWAYAELLPYADALAVGGTGMVAAASTHAVLARLAEASGNRQSAIDHARRAVGRERELGLRGFEARSTAILSELEQA